MKVKSLIILSLMLVFLCAAFAAPKPERSVYGIFSETFSGAVFDADVSNVNAVEDQHWQGQGFSKVSVSTETVDIVEGFECWEVKSKEGAWCGFAVHAKNSEGLNMNSYNCIRFVAKSTFSSMGNLEVGIQTGAGFHYKTLYDLNFSTDGNWHELTFPLEENSEKYNLENVTNFFVIKGDAVYPEDNIIYFDNIRWVKSTTTIATPNMALSLLKITDNSSADKFTFGGADGINIDTDLQETTWKIANEYIKIDVDFDNLVFNETKHSYDATQTMWVKIYTNNTSDTANPKYTGSIGKDYPMGLINVSATTEGRSLCWRISPDVISSMDNLKIYKLEGPDGQPHFSDDKNVLHYNYSWVKDKGYDYQDSDSYPVVWQNNSGFATRSVAAFNESTFFPAKFPLYLYLGADFSNVNSGDEYSTNTFTIELLYE